MAGSPGSGASLEGISLGSSEEADLQREGRERRSGEAGGESWPLHLPPPLGFGHLETVPWERALRSPRVWGHSLPGELAWAEGINSPVSALLQG